ncbi:MAG: hypothetical protein GY943_29975, partial [Chloroflexi bacterium]|nr:hypothetical protein [Chloroflexota bacterium]
MQKQLQKFAQQYPAIADLQARARRRLPHLAWEYLDCGTGEETAVSRNLTAFQNITMLPQF